MFKFKEKMEKWMSAVAFAEANEPERAREMAGYPAEPENAFSFDSLTTAIAFAEAGEHDKAREYMGVKESSSPSLDLASLGVKVWFGTVAFENAESGRG